MGSLKEFYRPTRTRLLWMGGLVCLYLVLFVLRTIYGMDFQGDVIFETGAGVLLGGIMDVLLFGVAVWGWFGVGLWGWQLDMVMWLGFLVSVCFWYSLVCFLTRKSATPSPI